MALPRTSDTQNDLGRVHRSDRIDSNSGWLISRGMNAPQTQFVGQIRDIMPLSTYEKLFYWALDAQQAMAQLVSLLNSDDVEDAVCRARS
jgi:hypothetical protein